MCMKILKKVSATPIRKNEGKIIDSFNTSDDKTINAPSINAVKKYVNGNFAVISGRIDLINGSGTINVNYPTGFSNSNSVVTSVAIDIMANNIFSYNGVTSNTTLYEVRATNNKIMLNCKAIDGIGSTSTKNFKIVLMKVDTDVSAYELGDVNMDGEVTEADYNIVNDFLQGTGTLTDKQFKLADMNSDGKIDAMDTYLLIQKINGNS